MRQRRPRVHDEAHLQRTRSYYCIVCGDNTSVEAAHIRFSCIQVSKRDTGGQEKPDDMWVLPMCSDCHRKQHKVSERGFWEALNIEPIQVAQALYIHRDDRERCLEILEANRRT